MLVTSEDSLIVCNEKGEIRKKIQCKWPLPHVSAEGELVAVSERRGDATTLLFLNEELEIEEQCDVPLYATPVLLDAPARTFLAMEGTSDYDPFQIQKSVQLWCKDQLLADLTKKYGQMVFLCTSRSGCSYFLALTPDDAKFVAIDREGHEMWRHLAAEKERSVSCKVWTDPDSGKDVAVLGYRDPSLGKDVGLMRRLLIDSRGQTIRDVSPMSYGTHTQSGLALLGDKQSIHCVQLVTGRTLWSRARAELKREGAVLGIGMMSLPSGSFRLTLVASQKRSGKQQGRAALIFTNLKTGTVEYEGSFEGTDWSMDVDDRELVWLISASGEVHRLRVVCRGR